jgi:hypothetical protein
MLHFERKRLKEIAAAEAGGKSFGTSKFEEAVRVKIFHALRHAEQTRLPSRLPVKRLNKNSP